MYLAPSCPRNGEAQPYADELDSTYRHKGCFRSAQITLWRHDADGRGMIDDRYEVQLVDGQRIPVNVPDTGNSQFGPAAVIAERGAWSTDGTTFVRATVDL